MVESVCVKGPFTGVIFVMQLNAIFVALNCKFQSAQANQLQFQPNSNAIHPHNITGVQKCSKPGAVVCHYLIWQPRLKGNP